MNYSENPDTVPAGSKIDENELFDGQRLQGVAETFSKDLKPRRLPSKSTLPPY
jgi:hypothetical protein